MKAFFMSRPLPQRPPALPPPTKSLIQTFKVPPDAATKEELDGFLLACCKMPLRRHPVQWRKFLRPKKQ